MQEIIIFLCGFAIISLAAKQIGKFFKDFNLPIISGFLLTGLVAGPYVLGLIQKDAIISLQFIDKISLGFIALIAGSEIYIEEFKSLFKSIKKITISMALMIILAITGVLYLISDSIGFMQSFTQIEKLGVSLLASGILCAISPSSTVAIIKELRAKGPFSQISLGVTVVMDVIVVSLFAFNSAIVDAIFKGVSFSGMFVVVLAIELLVSVLIGYLLGLLMKLILTFKIPSVSKGVIFLALGYSVFLLDELTQHFFSSQFNAEFVIEPLLICMIGSFYVSNNSVNRDEFLSILTKTSIPIYIIFFTLTGAALDLNLLYSVWPIALLLFAVRAAAMFIGSFTASIQDNRGSKFGSRLWMSFITQAGVGLGLAKQVQVSFPEWGSEFTTLIIAVIVLNQLVGPFFFKFAINNMGESHLRKSDDEYEGKRKAILFGANRQTASLALKLKSHSWNAKIACPKRDTIKEILNADVEIHPLPDFSHEVFKTLGAEKAGAFVFMLTDEENYRLCEIAYEHYGEANLIVHLNDKDNYDKFDELGCLIISPDRAIINLLDHFVRSPAGASLLLGMDDEQDVIDITVANPHIYGVYLKDLRLPLDSLVVSIHRDGHGIEVNGSVKLEVGDCVTVVGSPMSLDDIATRFGA